MDYATSGRAEAFTLGHLSPSAVTPLDDLDQMAASLADRIGVAASRLGNRADRLFGYRGEVVGRDTDIKVGSLSEAFSILNSAVTDLESQLQRFY